MNARREQILNLLIQSYIRSARPVPSAPLAARMNLSSATVRNELTALEREGYVQQPHTSAGRVPTQLAYRRYVSKFLPPKRLPGRQRRLLLRELYGAHGDSLLKQIASLSAELSGYVVVVSLPEDGNVCALEIHLSPLGSSRVLAVVVLETGLVRQLVVELDPLPSDAALSEAESSLRQLTLPVSRIPAALEDIAARAEAEVARTFRALAGSWPKLQPPTVVYQGLKYIMAEPESADPHFVRTLLERVEQPVIRGDGKPLAVTIEEALASVAAQLPWGASAGWLVILGPTRMRYPQALMVARGVAEAVSEVFAGTGEG
jgi:heat-inducible transcriptional repressor